VNDANTVVAAFAGQDLDKEAASALALLAADPETGIITAEKRPLTSPTPSLSSVRPMAAKRASRRRYR
jgi:hypothetical protein